MAEVAQKQLLLGLIGGGLHEPLAAKLQRLEAGHHGVHIHYQLIDLDLPASRTGAQDVPLLVRAAHIMGFVGLDIALPMQQAVVPVLDSLSDEAAVLGSVNAVVIRDGRTVGHQTEGSGWTWGLQRALPGADLGRVLLLGCGGAGAAIAHAVLGLGAPQLIVFDSDAGRAESLVARLALRHGAGRVRFGGDPAGGLPGALAQASGLIHATPADAAGRPGTQVPERLLHPGVWVSEVVNVPRESELLQAARRAGCATMDAGPMIVGQALVGFRLFTGLDPDPTRMEAHLRRLVY